MLRSLRAACLVMSCLVVAAGTVGESAQAQVPPIFPPPPAGSVISTPLPLDRFSHLVIDEARRHIFVSGGSGTSRVVVLNFRGELVKEINRLPSPAGMVMVGTKIFVARANGGGIDVLDAVRLRRKDPIKVPFTTQGRITFASGRLWLLSGECGSWESMYRVDPRTGRSKEVSNYASLYCATLFSHPANPHMLLTGETNLSPSETTRWDITHPSAARRESEHGSNTSGPDAAIASDGRILITGTSSGIGEVRASDLTPTGMTYDPGEESGVGSALAITDAEGGYVALGGGDPYRDEQAPNVYLFRRGNSEPESSMLLPGGTVAPGSLKFSPRAGKMFAVTYSEDEDSDGEPDSGLTFHSISGAPEGKKTKVFLKASRRKVTYPNKVRLTGRVDAPGDAASLVEIHAISFGRWIKRVGAKTVDGDGRFSFKLKPKRHTTYVARRRPTDAALAGISRGVTVRVRSRTHIRLKAGYGTRDGVRLYRVRKPIANLGWVSPEQLKQRVKLEAQMFRHRRWITVFKRDYRIRRKTNRALAILFSERPGSYRARFSFPGRYFLGPSNSKWRYLNVTR